MTEKEMKSMEFNKTISIGDYMVMRVPNGWIYLYDAFVGNRAVCAVFVPEFITK